MNDDACQSQPLSQWSRVGNGHTAAGVDGQERVAGHSTAPSRRTRLAQWHVYPLAATTPPRWSPPTAQTTPADALAARSQHAPRGKRRAARTKAARGTCGSAVGGWGGGARRSHECRPPASSHRHHPPSYLHLSGGGGPAGPIGPPPTPVAMRLGGGAAGSAEQALWRRRAAARRPHENWGRPPGSWARRAGLWLARAPQEQWTVIG